MSNRESKTAAPSVQDCHDLLAELRLPPRSTSVGIGANGFFVMIFDQMRRPPMVKFRGWPIEYHIGGGMPRAFGVSAA